MRKKPRVESAPKETPLNGFASTCCQVVVGLFALTFIFQNCFIPSSSMASTLLVGDHVMVERAMLAPRTSWMPILPYRDVKRGDVIVFYKPVPEPDGDHPFLVKRVIAIPGDRIHLRNGIVYLNGVAQNEPYAARPTADIYNPYVDDFPAIPPDGQPQVTATWSLLLPQSIQNGDLTVPPRQYFVMGDNRDRSLDSRFWGFVPRENIIGRPVLVYWSFKAAENNELKPALSEQVSSAAYEILHFFDKTRWTRTLHRIQ
jgi:signal peptidase I